MGHGSNVRALETTATYISDIDEFDIHTPVITAIKFWPGTMGVTANTAMVLARLIIGGKDYGVHNFIVPIRRISDHSCCGGVECGDLGPKIGFNNMDNGYGGPLSRLVVSAVLVWCGVQVLPLHSRANSAYKHANVTSSR